MKTTSLLSLSGRRSRASRSGRQSAFTMFEVLIVIVALGLLAALVVPTVDRFFDATGDTAKTHNAQVMNQYAETLFNAGVDTSTWTDAATAINALTAGVTIPATVPGGQTQEYTTYVEDNQVLAFGGLAGIGEADGVTKIPVAGDVPVIGYLFKSKSREVHQRNLVAYIIARVVHHPESARLPPMSLAEPAPSGRLRRLSPP